MSNSQLSFYEHQCLIVLQAADLLVDAPPEKQLTVLGFQNALTVAHFAMIESDVAGLLHKVSDEALLRAETWSESKTWRITREGQLRLADLIETRNASLLNEPTESVFSVTERFLNQKYPDLGKLRVNTESCEDETVVTICLTEGALNAWWDSLTPDAKAEAQVRYYEALDFAAQRCELTDAGKAAVNT